MIHNEDLGFGVVQAARWEMRGGAIHPEWGNSNTVSGYDMQNQSDSSDDDDGGGGGDDDDS
jgi:hypothetical protein